jgi:hypothetical protein
MTLGVPDTLGRDDGPALGGPVGEKEPDGVGCCERLGTAEGGTLGTGDWLGIELGLAVGVRESLGTEDGLPLGAVDSEGCELGGKLGVPASLGVTKGLWLGSIETEGGVLGPVVGARLG